MKIKFLLFFCENFWENRFTVFLTVNKYKFIFDFFLFLHKFGISSTNKPKMTGGMILFSVVLNSFVHVIMYSYYFGALFGPEVQRKLERIKKNITVIQMVWIFNFLMLILWTFYFCINAKRKVFCFFMFLSTFHFEANIASENSEFSVARRKCVKYFSIEICIIYIDWRCELLIEHTNDCMVCKFSLIMLEICTFSSFTV